jgi:DNA invertase Pin-like site-specific DNA recombinase
MRTVAYVRVSTGGQDLASQRLAILDYAHRQGLTVDTFVETHTSSRRPPGARGLDALLEQLHPGNVLLVSELSRLGRSVGQIIQLVDRLIQQRVRLIAIKENLQLTGTQDMQTKVMVTLLSLFAEIERDLIAERTKAGLAAARAKGRLPGRPKASSGRRSSQATRPRFTPSWPKRSRKRRSPKFSASPGPRSTISSSLDA